MVSCGTTHKKGGGWAVAVAMFIYLLLELCLQVGNLSRLPPVEKMWVLLPLFPGFPEILASNR